MNRPLYEAADVFRQYGEAYCQKYCLSPEQLAVFNLIKICRTPVLGGHLEKCDHCSFERPAYNSCRNRHCPKCQSLAKEKWLNDRRSELLPVGYFHLVFTIPHLLNPLILSNKKILLGFLFEAVNEVLTTFAKDRQWRLSGRIGFIAVLHTWSQTLMDHFHLHCLIPAGVLAFDEDRWINARRKYLFRNESLAKAFRRIYLRKLRLAHDRGDLIFPGKAEVFQSSEAFARLLFEVGCKKWIVFAKRPFATPDKVLAYLGGYTHRVAISNHRIVSVHEGKVTFTYRDRSDQNKKKQITLDAVEFIRRFLLHVLPDGFMKIRYYGFLSHRHKKRCVALIRALINPKRVYPEKVNETTLAIIERLTGRDINCCPQCGCRIRSYPLPLKGSPMSHMEIMDTS